MFSAIVFLVIIATVTAVPAGPTVPPCEQPVELGRCDAIKHRFAFFADTNECRQFIYGGCGGNANNFASLADCQAACPSSIPVKRDTEPVQEVMTTQMPMVTDMPVMVTEMPAAMMNDMPSMVTEKAADTTEKAADITEKPVEATTAQTDAVKAEDQNTAATEIMDCGCSSANCSDNAYLSDYYKELNCTPVVDPANPCCVVSYDCSRRTTLKADKCYHEGTEYAVGDNIPENKTPTCMVHCRCEQFESEKPPQIRCINIECGELWQPQPEPGCARQFKKDQCCSTGTYCEPKESTDASQVAPVKIAHCEFEGKTYVEGQKFFSDKNPCATCICQAGFNGTIEEPFCSQASCHLELFYSGYLRRGCVPVFYVDTCCPIDWRCPEECNMASEMPTTDDANTATTNQTNVSIKPGEKDVTPSGTTADSQMECAPEPLTKCEFGGVEYALGEKLPADVAGECVVCTCAVPPTPTCVKNEETCVRATKKLKN